MAKQSATKAATKFYGDLNNWWAEPDGANTRYTYKHTPQQIGAAKRLAGIMESALGIPITVEVKGAMAFIRTGYRPNCHIEEGR